MAGKPKTPPATSQDELQALPKLFSLVDLKDLRPSPHNARTHSVKQLAELRASMLQFGFTNPVLADGNTIVAGHGRTTALREIFANGDTVKLPSGALLPDGKVPVLDVSGWDEATRRAYTLADNQIALNADWDADLLAMEFDYLADNDFDVSKLGFPDDDATTPADNPFGENLIKRVETHKVADVFWISVSGPLEQQADALEQLKAVMGDIPGVEVELGTVRRDG